MSEIQSILIDKNYFTLEQANDWIKDKGFRPIKKVHETSNLYRFRITDPKLYSRFYVIPLAKNYDYIKFVMGVRK